MSLYKGPRMVVEYAPLDPERVKDGILEHFLYLAVPAVREAVSGTEVPLDVAGSPFYAAEEARGQILLPRRVDRTLARTGDRLIRRGGTDHMLFPLAGFATETTEAHEQLALDLAGDIERGSLALSYELEGTGSDDPPKVPVRVTLNTALLTVVSPFSQFTANQILYTHPDPTAPDDPQGRLMVLYGEEWPQDPAPIEQAAISNSVVYAGPAKLPGENYSRVGHAALLVVRPEPVTT